MVFTEMAIAYMPLLMARVRHAFFFYYNIMHWMYLYPFTLFNQHHATTTPKQTTQENYEQEQLVALVLACTANPSPEVNNYTLPFWYHLSLAFLK